MRQARAFSALPPPLFLSYEVDIESSIYTPKLPVLLSVEPLIPRTCRPVLLALASQSRKLVALTILFSQRRHLIKTFHYHQTGWNPL